MVNGLRRDWIILCRRQASICEPTITKNAQARSFSRRQRARVWPSQDFFRSSPRKRGPRLDSRWRGNERRSSSCHQAKKETKETKETKGKQGSGTPTDAVSHDPYASGARGAPRRGWLAPTLRLRARSPVGVPPRFSRQRPNATAQLQFTRFLGQNSLGTGVTRALPSQCSGLPRGPVVMPAGRFGPKPPGSGGDEAPPAGTVPAPAVRHHRTASLRAGLIR